MRILTLINMGKPKHKIKEGVNTDYVEISNIIDKLYFECIGNVFGF